MYTVMYRRIYVIRAMLSVTKQIGINQSNKLGRTALHLAAMNDDHESLALLARSRSDVTIRDSNDQSALHVANRGSLCHQYMLTVAKKFRIHAKQAMREQFDKESKQRLHQLEAVEKGARHFRKGKQIEQHGDMIAASGQFHLAHIAQPDNKEYQLAFESCIDKVNSHFAGTVSGLIMPHWLAPDSPIRGSSLAKSYATSHKCRIVLTDTGADIEIPFSAGHGSQHQTDEVRSYSWHPDTQVSVEDVNPNDDQGATVAVRFPDALFPTYPLHTGIRLHEAFVNLKIFVPGSGTRLGLTATSVAKRIQDMVDKARKIRDESGAADDGKDMDISTPAAMMLPPSFIKLVVFDFDMTILKIHTGGCFVGDPSQLVPQVSRTFLELAPHLISNGFKVAVATFSDENMSDIASAGVAGESLVRQVLDSAFLQYFLHESDAASRTQALSDAFYVVAANPTLRNSNAADSDSRMSNSKEWHIQQIKQQVRSRFGEIVEDNSIMFFDDSAKNIEVASAAGIHAFRIDRNAAFNDDVWRGAIRTLRS
jgi:Ankyrin repeats (3 copies)